MELNTFMCKQTCVCLNLCLLSIGDTIVVKYTRTSDVLGNGMCHYLYMHIKEFYILPEMSVGRIFGIAMLVLIALCG